MRKGLALLAIIKFEFSHLAVAVLLQFAWYEKKEDISRLAVFETC